MKRPVPDDDDELAPAAVTVGEDDSAGVLEVATAADGAWTVNRVEGATVDKVEAVDTVGEVVADTRAVVTTDENIGIDTGGAGEDDIDKDEVDKDDSDEEEVDVEDADEEDADEVEDVDEDEDEDEDEDGTAVVDAPGCSFDEEDEVVFEAAGSWVTVAWGSLSVGHTQHQLDGAHGHVGIDDHSRDPRPGTVTDPMPGSGIAPAQAVCPVVPTATQELPSGQQTPFPQEIGVKSEQACRLSISTGSSDATSSTPASILLHKWKDDEN